MMIKTDIGSTVSIRFKSSLSNEISKLSMVQLQRCRVGDIPPSNNFGSCTTCEEETYAVERGATTCLSCEVGAICYGGDNIVAQVNYWQAPGIYSFYECPYLNSCKGGSNTNNTCGEGYQGVLCAICADDYKKTAAGCEHCGAGVLTPSASNIIVFSVLMVVALFVTYHVAKKVYKLILEDQHEQMQLLIAEAFETFDEDGSGALDPAEIQGAIDELEELDDIEGKEDLQKSLEALKGVDEIKVNEFQEAFVCKSILELISRIALFSECLEKMKARQKQLRIETEMEAAQVRYTEHLAKMVFNIFDEDGSGTISPQELEEVQEKLQMRGEEVSHLCFEHEDITFDEFFNSISGDDYVVTRRRLHQVADVGNEILYDRRLRARILAKQEVASVRGLHSRESIGQRPTHQDGRAAMDAVHTAYIVDANVDMYQGIEDQDVEEVDEDFVEEAIGNEQDADFEVQGQSTESGPPNKKNSGDAQDQVQGQSLDANPPNPGDIGKLLFGHFQVQTSFSATLNIGWPSVQSSFIDFFTFVNVDWMGMVIPCMNLPTYDSITIILVTPVAVVLVLLVLEIARIRLLEVPEHESFTLVVQLLLKLIFAVYPLCSGASVWVFLCQKVEGDYYMKHDYRYHCYDSQWWGYAVFSIVGFLVYPIGCPLLYWVILKRHRHKLYLDEETEELYGFIYERYEPRCYTHEILEMLRKFMLTAVVGIIAPGSIDQTISALMIATAFLVYHLKYQPFLHDEEDNIQSASFTTIVITLAIGISLEAQGTNTFKTSLLVFVNVGTVVFCLVQTAIFLFNSMGHQVRNQLQEIGLLEGTKQNDEYKGLDEQETTAKSSNDHKRAGNVDVVGKAECIKAVVVDPEQGMKEDDEFCAKANDEDDGEVCDEDHIMEEVDKCVAEAFKRFDFDGSGTINSHDELQMLTMHVLFKMDHTNAKYSQQGALDSVDAFAEVAMEEGWTPEQYSNWFKEQILKG